MAGKDGEKTFEESLEERLAILRERWAGISAPSLEKLLHTIRETKIIEARFLPKSLVLEKMDRNIQSLDQKTD